MTIWKWSDESWYPGALSPVLENFKFRPAFSPDPTDCPWVSEDGITNGPVIIYVKGGVEGKKKGGEGQGYVRLARGGGQTSL